MSDISISAQKKAAPGKSAARRRAEDMQPATLLASAKRYLSPETVVSPYEHDKVEHLTEQVVRVLDPIEVLYKRGKIKQPQRDAAIKYRGAYERQNGSLTGTLDPDKTGGGGSGSRTPHSGVLAACDLVAEAHAVLGVVVAPVVRYIAGHGLTIEQCATVIYGPTDKRGDLYRNRIIIADMLKQGLTALAVQWRLEAAASNQQQIRASSDGARATVMNIEIVRGKVAHAARGKLDYSNGE